MNLSIKFRASGEFYESENESTLQLVNYTLKLPMSVLETNFGMNGAFTFFSSNILKFIF